MSEHRERVRLVLDFEQFQRDMVRLQVTLAGGDACTNCPICRVYRRLRTPVIAEAAIATSRETGESTSPMLARLIRGVHARHLAGLPVLPDRDPAPNVEGATTDDC